MKNKHLLFAFEYPPVDGGISRLCEEIAAEYERVGKDIRVLTQEVQGSCEKVNANGIPEIRVALKRPWREIGALRRLWRERKNGPVICGIWYPEGLLALLSGSRPLVILALGSELMPVRSIWRRSIWKRLLRHVLTSADLVIAISEYTRDLVVACAPKCKVVTVPLAVDHERFSPGNGDAAKRKFKVFGKKVICSVSRIQAYKGHEVVFQALAALPPPVREQFVYLVAGKGPDEVFLKAKARELGVEPLVRWLGYVKEEELAGLYRASDLFALCTREEPDRQEVEGFGLVFLEAQACGTPVVGTRTGGISDAVEDGDGGWLIDQDDSAALGEILIRMVNDPEGFRGEGRAARERVEREFTWGHYMRRFIKALEAEGI